MKVTDLPIFPRSAHPVGCKLLLRSLPGGVTARYGMVPGHDGAQFVLHDGKCNAVCDLGHLDFVTLRAMLDSLGYEKHKVWTMSATDAVAGHA